MASLTITFDNVMMPRELDDIVQQLADASINHIDVIFERGKKAHANIVVIFESGRSIYSNN